MLMVLVSSFTLSSCIDETLPTSGVTDEQVPPTEESAEALVMGLNNQFSKYGRQVTIGQSDMPV